MSPEFWLKALEYGVLGFCLVGVISVWQLILVEQQRPGPPRRGMIFLSSIFMGFCLMLAGLNAYVQRAEGRVDARSLASLRDRIEAARKEAALGRESYGNDPLAHAACVKHAGDAAEMLADAERDANPW